MKRVIRIATRQSPLALWQAECVKSLIESCLSQSCTLVPLSTTGDEIQHCPLAEVGGKGLFIKKLEEALLRGEADIAVHSMKDVPAILDPAFHFPAILERAVVNDVLITRQPIQSLSDLKQGAKIGTSSYRRQAQLKRHHISGCYVPIRGNVETRLRKMETEGLDGLVLAQAGLQRLNISPPYQLNLPLHLCLPAAGQGAIGIECLSDQGDLIEQLAALNCLETATCVKAERAFIATLQGHCHSPIACLAHLEEQTLILQGRVLSPEGLDCIEGIERGHQEEISVGLRLGQRLLQQGAKKILDLPYSAAR